MSRPTNHERAIQPIPRLLAVANGWPFYVTGKRCVYGHASPRLVRNRECRECAKIRNTKRIRSRETCDRLNQWKLDNVERERENSRIRAACRRAVDPQKHRDAVNRYRQEHPEVFKKHCIAWHTSQKQQCPSWADQKKIREIYLRAQRLTEETGIEHHVDHEIPLRGETVSGLHVENNLQVLKAVDNMRKGNSFNG